MCCQMGLIGCANFQAAQNAIVRIQFFHIFGFFNLPKIQRGDPYKMSNINDGGTSSPILLKLCTVKGNQKISK